MTNPVTSEQSPIRVDFIPSEILGLPGRVGLTLAPGKHQQGATTNWERDLDQDLQRLVEHYGATLLVSLVEQGELKALGIPHLIPEARSRGMEVRHFPLEDGSIPEVAPLLDVVARILEVAGAGGTTVIHCKGGLGRSGLVAASCLLARGLSVPDAIRATRKARRGAIEPVQEAFLPKVAAALKGAGVEPHGEPPARSAGAAARPVPSLRDRVRGALYGLAVGDALGAPYELTGALAELQRRGEQVAELVAGGGWAKGEWTDDTALALATAEAYADGPCIDPERAARAMLRWLASGPKDVGNLTRTALVLMRDRKVPARMAGRVAMAGKAHSAGNGSLMRAAPTGLVRHPDDPLLVGESIALSAITHADERCLGACVAFNVVLSSLVFRPELPLDDVLVAASRSAVIVCPEVAALVDGVRRREPLRHADSPRGYVLVCLERALAALRDAPSPREGLVAVVMAGGDTDTNAAVAGALLGAKHGFGAIPASWLGALQGKRELETAIGRLLWAVRDWTGPARPPLPIPERPAQLDGIFACTLPLPPGCPRREVALSCVGCPIAELQERAAHAEVDPERVRARARELLRQLYEDGPANDGMLDYMVELYLRPEIEGNSLAKAALFTGYKAKQFQCDVRFTTWGRGVAKGEPVVRWPDGVAQSGPTWKEVFEIYTAMYDSMWD